MSDRPIFRQRARRLLASVAAPAVCVLLLSAPLLQGCGSGPSSEGALTSLTLTESAVTTAPPSPAVAFSAGVIDTWAEAMQRLVTMIQAQPDAAAVRSDVENLNKEYVQELVEYGRQRESFSADDKEQADSLISTALTSLGEESWYQSYMALYNHYSTGDLDFANLLASFNILTQYADFELLKQQEPEEAARLGIE